MKPYALLSDIHFHNWSAFSTHTSEGINSRLQIILDELERAAAELKRVDGNLIVMAGDLFHVRGSIDPEVFNPVHEKILRLCDSGFQFVAIPGNHDLKDRDTTELGNAFQSLGAIEGFHVVTKPTSYLIGDIELMPWCKSIALIPWCKSIEEVRTKAKEILSSRDPEDLDPSSTDLIIHTGINGVLKGLPDHGLNPDEIASWGFRRVFSGHYHNHKSFCDGKVVSIGATTHQTWSDIGTKAGFLIVYDDHFEYRASQAASFVEVTAETDPDEIPLIVDGNYVRVHSMKLSDAEINKRRGELTEMGARGVSFQVMRDTVDRRSGAAMKTTRTLEESVSKYVDDLEIDDVADKEFVNRKCAEIIADVRAKEDV